MEQRTKVALLAVIIATGVPASSASAECPPIQQKDGDLTVELEVSVERGGVVEFPMLSNESAGANYAAAEPAVMLNVNRDPANLLINPSGLVEERTVEGLTGQQGGAGSRIEALAGSIEQFQHYVGQRVLGPVPSLEL